ncbi:hypothetical protein F5Y10DRAFT_206846 [Nemania abortiva]|nr:hypothetical protein F5Y10DRAFT_206846 [Nemania abortiva]
MARPFHRQANTLIPFLPDEMITIETSSGTQYIVHARPLAYLSLYFFIELNDNYQGPTTRTFRLNEHCENKVLEIFIDWMCFRNTVGRDRIDREFFLQGIPLTIAVKAWLLGAYLQSPDFQDDMMRYIMAKNMRIYGRRIIQEFGAQAPENSCLEFFFVDMFCHLMTVEKSVPPEVMRLWLTPRLMSEVSVRFYTAPRSGGVGEGPGWMKETSRYFINKDYEMVERGSRSASITARVTELQRTLR